MNTKAFSRRNFLATGTMLAGLSVLPAGSKAAEPSPVVFPPADRKLHLACKLSMITREQNGRKLSAADRLSMAAEAGFDGVDFDQAGEYTPEEARAAVQASGVFVHNAINHAHWEKRLTSANAEDREKGRSNAEHCIRVSQAAGGSGILLVIGRAEDGPAEVVEQRAHDEMLKLLPLAGTLGQMVLVENVWNKMMYDHEGPPDQSPERFIRFVDSFQSPWVGMYYDLGNHWKYAQPGDWIRAFGRRCVKLDAKGFSRAKNKFVDILSEEDDLPWKEVRKALADINYNGWATAEVGGGNVQRLKIVHEQMRQAFGL